MNYYVYILSSEDNKKLYVGVTKNLIKRTYEHKMKFVQGYAEKYNINKLIYYEIVSDVYSAITREKQIKSYRRQKKDNLINKINPNWKDLYKEIIE